MTQSSPQFTIQVLLFGVLKETVQSEQIALEFRADTENVSVAHMLQLLAQQSPELAKYLPHVRVAVNCEYASHEQIIHSCDEVALIPPVAGGCTAL